MLDAMDVLLYSFVLDDVRREFGIDDRMSGVLLALPLAASAIGGIAFGWLADRIGRTRALSASILLYAVATAACGVATDVWQLAIARLVLGLGMGGEWATGAALVAETWPAEHRGKAMGLMQSAWAVGYALAAAVNALVLPRFGWRAVFLVGLVPALVTLWIRRRVDESPLWLAGRAAPRPTSGLAAILRGPGARITWVLMAMNAATMFAWWGLFTWIPSYLARPIDQGGAGLVDRPIVHVDHRDADRHVVRLRVVRIHRRCDRPEEELCDLPDRRRRARADLCDGDATFAGSCFLVRSWRSLGRAISAASVP